jgi:hypothetical protein
LNPIREPALHNPIQNVSLLYYEAVASLRRIRNWFPLFLFWLIQALLLTALTRFLDLPGSERVATLLRDLFGEEVLEYPRFYILLPDMQRRLYLVLAAILGVYLQGVTILQLLGQHSGGKLQRRHPWRRTLKRWPGLFLINLLGLVLFLGPLFVVKQWLLPAIGSAGPGRLIVLASYGLGFLVEIFLLYAAFLYVSFSSGWWTSVKSSIGFARRRFWTSLILVLVPFFLALPIQAITSMRRAIVFGFRPELIYYLLLTSSFLTLLVLFIQLSTVVRFYAEEKLRRPFEGE